jgi:hypothetical protein
VEILTTTGMVFLAMAENDGGRLPSMAPRVAAASGPDGSSRKNRASNRVNLKRAVGRVNRLLGFIGVFGHSQLTPLD